MKKGLSLMRNRLYLWPVGLVLLAGCAARTVDLTPVWQQQLPQTGVTMELSNCTLVEDAPVYYAMDRDDENWEERPALKVAGIPVVTLRGVEQDQVELRFAENVDYLYLYYDKVMPQQDLDYILTLQEDGSLQYRLDTVYNYEFVITTPDGTDDLLVICQQDNG